MSRTRTEPARAGATAEDLGLVLRRFRYGESSLVAHVLTRAHGRVAILAKGAYRLHSGFMGVIDLFDTLRLCWSVPGTARRGGRAAPGTAGSAVGPELAVLRSASLARRRKAVCADLERYRAGLSILEVAGLGARAGSGDPGLFRRVEEALDELHRGRAEPGLVRTAFELGFLTEVGLAPALEHCASCARTPGRAEERGGRVPFSVARGGRLCERCAAEAAAEGRKIETVPLQWVRIARSLMASSRTPLDRIHLDARTRTELQDFVERFLEYHLEARPRAWGGSPRAERSARRRHAPRHR